MSRVQMQSPKSKFNLTATQNMRHNTPYELQCTKTSSNHQYGDLYQHELLPRQFDTDQLPAVDNTVSNNEILSVIYTKYGIPWKNIPIANAKYKSMPRT